MKNKTKFCLLALAVSSIMTAHVSAKDDELAVWDITASSSLAPSEYGDYYAWNLADYNKSTAWVEGVSGNGCYESVTFTFPQGAVVTGISIWNGYCKSEDIYLKNSAPSMLSYKANGKTYYLDLGRYSNDFYLASDGAYIEFEEPAYTVDGTLTFTIEDVRAGWKYTDTCISEIHPRGYISDQTAPDLTPSAPTVPETEPTVNPWPQSQDEEEVPEDLNEDIIQSLTSESGWIYKKHIGYTLVDNVEIFLPELTSEDRAMLAYWYQYFAREDLRIMPDMEYNIATYDSMKAILTEMFGDCTQDDIQTFVEHYVQKQEGNRLWMYGTGDFGDAGSYIFEKASPRVEDGLLRLDGTITQYDYNTNQYVPVTTYSSWYSLHSVGAAYIHTFVKMQVGKPE